MTLELLEDPAIGQALANNALIPLSQMLTTLPAVVLTADGVRRAVHGRELRKEDAASGCPLFDSPVLASSESEAIRLISTGGELVGIAARGHDSGILHPLVILM